MDLDLFSFLGEARRRGGGPDLFATVDGAQQSLVGHAEGEQMIFFNGQMYDPFELLVELVGKAEKSIVLVDGYVDLGTLNILKKKRKGVAVTVWAKKKGDKLSDADIEAFRAQYGSFELKHPEAFHDRFLILDGTTSYHIGASIKDAGKKCFGINLMQDEAMIEVVLEKFHEACVDY